MLGVRRTSRGLGQFGGGLTLIGLFRGGRVSGRGVSRGLEQFGGGLALVGLLRGGRVSGHGVSRGLGGSGGNIPHAGLLCGQLDLIRVLLRLLGDGSVSLLGRIAEFSAKGIAFFLCHSLFYLQNLIYLQKRTSI